jgi:hemolysin III
MQIPRKEKISAYSHAAAIPVMIAGIIIMIIISRGNISHIIVVLIYGFSAIALFTASFLYHSKKRGENETSIWRKLDHAAIFIFIAGTYTPMCYIYLNGWMKWGILIAQWSLVFFGIIFKFLFINAPRFIGTMIYLAMGWIAVIPIKQLYSRIPGDIMFFLAAGGLAYTLGAVIYVLKKPDPLPDYLGFHELFHLFIVAGAIFHLGMVIKGIEYAHVV